MEKIKGFLFAVRHREILMIWDKSVYLQVYICTSQVDLDIKAVCAEYLYL